MHEQQATYLDYAKQAAGTVAYIVLHARDLDSWGLKNTPTMLKMKVVMFGGTAAAGEGVKLAHH